MTSELEIMFDDLIEEAQARVLELYGLESATNGNFENCPLFILQSEEDN